MAKILVESNLSVQVVDWQGSGKDPAIFFIGSEFLQQAVLERLLHRTHEVAETPSLTSAPI